MTNTQIIKGLLDILNSNHEKMKLTNEQIALKNEAHKLLSGQEGYKITGKRAFDGDIGVDGIEDIKAKIAKYIEPADIDSINKITPSNCRGLK